MGGATMHPLKPLKAHPTLDGWALPSVEICPDSPGLPTPRRRTYFMHDLSQEAQETSPLGRVTSLVRTAR